MNEIWISFNQITKMFIVCYKTFFFVIILLELFTICNII